MEGAYVIEPRGLQLVNSSISALVRYLANFSVMAQTNAKSSSLNKLLLCVIPLRGPQAAACIHNHLLTPILILCKYST